MQEKKNIIFSFDYELFLGQKSGAVQECLIKPIERILELLNIYKIKGIFFVDTTYLMALKKVSLRDPLAEKDLNLIFLQLCNLIRQGHYIFPHLHPHWLDAVYLPETREWQLFDLSKYRFHNLDDNQKHYLFSESIKILRDVTFPINPDYRIDAYRAGGWSLEPFSDFVPFFKKFDIKYDFSVLRGLAKFSKAEYFDYSDVNSETDVYHFQNDVKQQDTKGNCIEFCVSILRLNKTIDIINRIWLRIINKVHNIENCKKGIGVVSQVLAIPNKNNLKNRYYQTASIEWMTMVTLPFYIKFLENNGYMHIASHPKIIGTHNSYIFRKFLENIYKRYQIETDFRKMI